MDGINLPGFTAEASLSTLADHYRETWDSSRLQVRKVEPQLLICDFFGSMYCCSEGQGAWHCIPVPKK
jgi:hypothetical protein